MLSLLATLLLTAPEIPAQCQGPAAREMAPLTQFAQGSGSLSVGLDSVATWCFDSTGGWTGGGEKADPRAVPIDDCKKAIESCESAKKALSPDARKLLFDTLAELDQPFLGVKYQPKRSGLAERPPEGAECGGRDRALLFSSAQARMDLARLASVVQNEYANYRTWLFSEGLKCAQQVARDEKDPTRRGVAVDAKVKGGGTQQVPGQPGEELSVAAPPTRVGTSLVDAGAGGLTVAAADAGAGRLTAAGADAGAGRLAIAGASSSPDAGRSLPLSFDAGALAVAGVIVQPLDGGRAAVVTYDAGVASGRVATVTQPGSYVGGPTAERERALSSSMVEKWRYFLSEQQKIEGDPDWLAGFLASRELRDCRCPLPRPVPGELVRRLSNNDRVAQLEQDDERTTRCELCLLDSYPKWKARAQKQCALLKELTPYEIEVLQRSDDGNGLPPRCIDAAKQKVDPPSRTGVVRLGNDGAPPEPQRPANNGHFVILQVDAGVPVAAPAPVQPVVLQPVASATSPQREVGRVYLRVSMSRACMAEVLMPQAIAVHDGDVLPVPISARELVVRGACGGIAELLYGKDENPKVSEPFSSDKPVHFKFRE